MWFPEASVAIAPETGPLSWTHQPARPGHGEASTNTWPSISAVPPPPGALPHVGAGVGGGGGGGGGWGGGGGGGGSATGHLLITSPGCSAARAAQCAAS